MSTSLAIKSLSEDERIALIEHYRKEADSFAAGVFRCASRCPIGEVRPVTVNKLGKPNIVYIRDTCDCPETTAKLGMLPFLCSMGGPCLTKKTLFPNGTFS